MSQIDPNQFREIDPKEMKADLRKALAHCDEGRPDLAAAALEAHVAKLNDMLTTLDRMEAFLREREATQQTGEKDANPPN
jgi:hypothetical protein